ncbi:MAG: hypothetical protein AAF206_31430 [Bacteroidota bacterium]
MKNSIKIALAAFFFTLSFGLTSLNAQTPGCSSAANTVSTMWQKYGEWSPSIGFSAWASKADRAIRLWNQAARNSWATIGPRSLNLPRDTESGTILGQTNRTFVTPPSFHNTIEITINKTDGRAKTGITICTKSRNGSRRTVHSYTFNNGNRPMRKVFTINNAKGKVISVSMRNYSVGNKFKYTISSKKK